MPLFAKTHEADGQAEARRFAEESLAALALVLIVVTILAEIFMAGLTFVLAPGFKVDPEKFDLAVLLGRIAFPYLFLISIVSLLSGALNGLGRFAAAAFSPSLLNAVLIAALIYIYFQHQIGSVEAGVIADRRDHRRRHHPAGLPADRLPPRRNQAQAAPAAPDAGCEAAGKAGPGRASSPVA